MTERRQSERVVIQGECDELQRRLSTAEYKAEQYRLVTLKQDAEIAALKNPSASGTLRLSAFDQGVEHAAEKYEAQIAALTAERDQCSKVLADIRNELICEDAGFAPDLVLSVRTMIANLRKTLGEEACLAVIAERDALLLAIRKELYWNGDPQTNGSLARLAKLAYVDAAKGATEV